MSPEGKRLAGLLAAARRAGWDHGRCYAPDHEWRRGDSRVRLCSMYNPRQGRDYWRLTVSHDGIPLLSARVTELSELLPLLDWAAINPLRAVPV